MKDDGSENPVLTKSAGDTDSADACATTASGIGGPGGLTISATHFRPLIAAAQNADLPVETLLNDLSLDPAFQVSESLTSHHCLADYFRLQNRLGYLLADETCHLSDRTLMPGSTDFVLRNVSTSGTLVEAMAKIAVGYNLLHGGNYNRVEERGGSVSCVIDDRDFHYSDATDSEQALFAIESTLIFLFCILVTLNPHAAFAGLKTVEIRRNRAERPPHGDTHLNFWSVPIRFGCPVYRLTFDAAHLAGHPITCRPEDLNTEQVYATIERLVSPAGPLRMSGIETRVCRLIADGHEDQTAIAKALGISVATLRRRLTAANTNFRTLREQVLNERARRLLSLGHSPAEVGERLGFSDQRSFNRAFKRWNGATPRTFVNTL